MRSLAVTTRPARPSDAATIARTVLLGAQTYVAFAPAESPKIAFALVAEDAGPAEYAGAKVAHDFLESVRDRLR